jgi:hypothetical protein
MVKMLANRKASMVWWPSSMREDPQEDVEKCLKFVRSVE